MDGLLRAWFVAHGRDLPWRGTRDPYAVLVSEVMLHQTQVERVIPRYLRWLELWPTPAALASASPAEVIREWQGLGYNRRAVNLHRAAQAVAADGWPDDLTRLPGVGPYTAAAIRNQAFGERVLPVDTNVARIQQRTGHTFAPGVAPGALRPRRDDLPRADPTLRRLPAREPMSVSRADVRAAAEAVALRGLVPPAPRGPAPARRRGGATGRRTRRREQSSRCSRTASSSRSTRSSACRPRRGVSSRHSARRACRRRRARRAGRGSRGTRTRRPPGSASRSTPPSPLRGHGSPSTPAQAR